MEATRNSTRVFIIFFTRVWLTIRQSVKYSGCSLSLELTSSGTPNSFRASSKDGARPNSKGFTMTDGAMTAVQLSVVLSVFPKAFEILRACEVVGMRLRIMFSAWTSLDEILDGFVNFSFSFGGGRFRISVSSSSASGLGVGVPRMSLSLRFSSS